MVTWPLVAVGSGITTTMVLPSSSLLSAMVVRGREGEHTCSPAGGGIHTGILSGNPPPPCTTRAIVVISCVRPRLVLMVVVLMVVWLLPEKRRRTLHSSVEF